MQVLNGVYFFPRISDLQEGFGARPPKNLETLKAAGKKLGVIILIHGVGERGTGDLEALKNVIDGFDYDGPGPLPRQYAIETEQFEAAIQQYQFIGVTVNYPTDFKPNDINYVIDTVKNTFPVDDERIAIIGFSWGGKAVLDYICSSVENAKRLSFAAAAAPVNSVTNVSAVIQAGLQFIGTTYTTDPRVSADNVKRFISAIASNTPKPVLIEYPGTAHGGFLELINYSFIYEYFIKTTRSNRLQFIAPGVTVKPIEPVPNEPVIVTPIVSYNIVGNTISLIGSNSKGYSVGYDGTWALKSAPEGVTSKMVFPFGSSYINANGVLPSMGTYIFTFTLKGSNPVNLTIEYGTVPLKKEVVGFDSTTVTYDDGSQETGKAIYKNGKWQLILANGTVINF